MQRARGIYGDRVADLGGAVKAGDFNAVLAEKNAFDLFNSGAFKMGPKSDKKECEAATKDIFAAVSKGDKAGLQSSYATFMKAAKISDGYDEKTSSSATQGASNDFDWKQRNKKGKGNVYVR